MNIIWQNITWHIARAGGFTSYVLLTLAVVVGLALSTQLQSRSHWPRLINSELHNFLTLLSTVFLVIHVLAVAVDPFTHFHWDEILIPFISHYRPLWMACGIIGLYLGIAIAISTWLRSRISYTWWKRLHVFTLLVFALAATHGIATGSDTRAGWALGIYIGSVALVCPLLYRRLFLTRKKRKPVTTRPGTTKPRINTAPAASTP